MAREFKMTPNPLFKVKNFFQVEKKAILDPGTTYHVRRFMRLPVKIANLMLVADKEGCVYYWTETGWDGYLQCYKRYENNFDKIGPRLMYKATREILRAEADQGWTYPDRWYRLLKTMHTMTKEEAELRRLSWNLGEE